MLTPGPILSYQLSPRIPLRLSRDLTCMSSMLLPQRLTEKIILFLECISTALMCGSGTTQRVFFTESDQSSHLASDRISWSANYKIRARRMRSTRVSTVVSSVTRCSRKYSGPSRLTSRHQHLNLPQRDPFQKSNRLKSRLLCSSVQ